jgi:hypothetical protein
MMEYKIINGSPKYCQMKLDQWKHDYNLEILEIKWITISFWKLLVSLIDLQLWDIHFIELIILLTRTSKEKARVPF